MWLFPWTYQKLEFQTLKDTTSAVALLYINPMKCTWKKLTRGLGFGLKFFIFGGLVKTSLLFWVWKLFILFSWVSNCDAVYFLGVRLKDLESQNRSLNPIKPWNAKTLNSSWQGQMFPATTWQTLILLSRLRIFQKRNNERSLTKWRISKCAPCTRRIRTRDPTVKRVVKRATSEPRLQLPKCLQIFAIYTLTLVMYIVASPGSTT